jgi:preprotein translocase subunit SecF
MSWLGKLGSRLYRGEIAFDFVSRRRLWYMISGAILVIAIVALAVRGLNFSVDFKGGSQWTVNNVPTATATQLEKIVTNNGAVSASATAVHPFTSAKPFWQVQAGLMPTNQAVAISGKIATFYHIAARNVSVTTVGASWGSQVTTKAIEALIAFLIVIVIYLSIAFDWRMAASAFVALMHDIVITVGVYALTGFQVSEATVIGLLTILGYSLYDTVVVFDKVRENTAGLLETRRSNYSQAANLALNQTLVRSINTSLTALLPVAAILVVGTLLLGNGELKDLALVLFVGMLSGTYSSICIATPVLADLKERQPQYKQLAKQVALRAAGGRAALRRAAKTAKTGATAGNGVDLTDVDLGGGLAAAAAGVGTGPAGGRPAGLSGTDSAGSGPGRSTAGAGAVDPGLDEDTDEDLPDEELAGEPVGAAPGGSGGQMRGVPSRSGARQQPVRRPAAKRRPSGKKKRR